MSADDIAKVLAEGANLGDEALIKIGRAAVKLVAKMDAHSAIEKELKERCDLAAKAGSNDMDSLRLLMLTKQKEQYAREDVGAELVRLEAVVHLLTGQD